MSSIRRFARLHPLGAFLSLVYSLAAAIFALPLLSVDGIGLVDIDLGGVAPFLLFATLGLAAVAAVVTLWDGGWPAFCELRQRTFRLRVPIHWYLGAMFLLPFLALVTAAIGVGIGPLQQLLETPGNTLGTVILGAGASFVVINWWEEVGWTGFVVHRLQASIGPLGASVISTWLQATVHVPLLFIAEGVTDGRLDGGQVRFYLVALYILPLPVRIMITWLYNTSGQSLPIVGLFHAGFGVATGSAFIPSLAPGFDLVWLYGGFAVAALVVITLTQGRLGYLPEPPKIAPADHVSVGRTQPSSAELASPGTSR